MLSDGERLYLIAQETLGWTDGAEWAYPLGDALGSVRQVVDGAGEVLDDRTWTPFGVEEGTAQGGLGYTGEWWDAEVSLLYLRARWYDPAVGRFTTEDPAGGYIQIPASQHIYVYAWSNPVNWVDPAGLQVSPPLPELDFDLLINDDGSTNYDYLRMMDPLLVNDDGSINFDRLQLYAPQRIPSHAQRTPFYVQETQPIMTAFDRYGAFLILYDVSGYMNRRSETYACAGLADLGQEFRHVEIYEGLFGPKKEAYDETVTYGSLTTRGILPLPFYLGIGGEVNEEKGEAGLGVQGGMGLVTVSLQGPVGGVSDGEPAQAMIGIGGHIAIVGAGHREGIEYDAGGWQLVGLTSHAYYRLGETYIMETYGRGGEQLILWSFSDVDEMHMYIDGHFRNPPFYGTLGVSYEEVQ